jgi:sialidase-1
MRRAGREDMITQHAISRDDRYYHAFPDVARTRSGRLVCLISECIHHGDRSYTRIALRDSVDRGRTWSEKRYLTDATSGMPFWNCPRITALRDGRLVALVDSIGTQEQATDHEKLRNFVWFREDEGRPWSAPVATPAHGIVPDKVRELASGRWLLACHVSDPETRCLTQRLWYSDDRGMTWQGPVIVGRKLGLNLCEVSILEVEPGVLVAFMRENSGKGWDAYKTISRDNGETWGEPIAFPLPGCHRPVAGFLADGRIMVTHRFMQGGKGWLGSWTQNFFAAVTDKESALASTREGAWTRILPVDFDRSPKSDLGYSGWVQFPDGEIYIVSYIVDDWPRGQIRGYSLTPDAFVLPGTAPR